MSGDAQRQRKASLPESLRGHRRIVWMSGWDQDYVDMAVPGYFMFAGSGQGHFQFGLVQARMDGRRRAGSNPPRIEFTWHGFDEGDEDSLDHRLDARRQRGPRPLRRGRRQWLDATAGVAARRAVARRPAAALPGLAGQCRRLA